MLCSRATSVRLLSIVGVLFGGALPAGRTLAQPSALPDHASRTQLSIAVTPSVAVTGTSADAASTRLQPAGTGGALGLTPTQSEQRKVDEERIAAALGQQEARAAEQQARRAHDAALAAAARARTVAERALANELARIEAARIQVARVGSELAQERSRDAVRAQVRIDREAGFFERLTSPTLKPGQALALFKELDAALGRAHKEMRAALAERAAASRVPVPASDVSNAAADLAEPAQLAKLKKARAALREQSDKATTLELRLRHATANSAAAEVLRLGRHRARAIAALTAVERTDLVSLSRRGATTLQRELDHVRLVLRWTPSVWRQALAPAAENGDDMSSIGKTSVAIVELLLLLGAWLLLRARWRGWLTLLAPLLRAEVHNLALRQVVDALVRILQALGGELLFLVVVSFGGDVLVGESTPPELAAMYAVLLTYAWYRLLLQAVHRYLRNAAQIGGRDLTEAAEARIIWSLRLAGRYSFGVVAAVVFVDHIVGAGFLSTWIGRLFWGGALVILGLLLRSWRPAITSAYLANYPSGRLADLVRKTQGQAIGAAVAIAAFSYVAVRGITLYLRQLAMRFEHTRRALAYLFRRRLERHADRISTGDSTPEDLPARLQAVFTEPRGEGIPLIAGGTSLDAIAANIEEWIAQGGAQDAMVFGERGVGRTTWLECLRERVDGAVTAADDVTLHTVTVDDRILSEAALCRFLADELGVQQVFTVAELAKLLHAGPRRVLFLDDVQLLVLRSMDGLDAIRALTEFVVATADRVFCVCTCTNPAWRFIGSINRDRNVFATAVQLGAWSEDRIRELVQSRMDVAGVQARYEDLVLDQLDADVGDGTRAAERFHRLLWDHADGNPRAAMYTWLRSLAPSSDTEVRVRLFRAADPDRLEELGELSRFVLACIAQHDHLSVDEAVRALGEPARDCRMTLTWLVTRGYVIERADRYFISRKWHRATLRYLRRKHLAY